MEKKLVINCANCDTRKVREETLAAYDRITINAAVIFTDAGSRAILDKYPVTMNCASILDVDGDVRVTSVNGKGQIRSTDTPDGRQFLIVNGALDIGPGTEAVLKQYVGILVNGSVTYPESLGGALGGMTVNGTTCCYPDGAVVLKSSAVIDRTFALRAKNNLYWAKKRMIMVDPALDPAALAAKGATFSAPEILVAESKVEALIGLLDERADITIVPDDGTAVICDDVTLDSGTLRRYGKKLYILGDVTVEQDGQAVLEQLEYLNIRGDVTVPKELKDLLLEKAAEITGDVEISVSYTGRVIHDKVSVRISRWLLEQEPDGIHVDDCAKVTIDPDVPGELILHRLTIRDCAKVSCTPDQEDALAAVCDDVAQIGGASGKEETSEQTNRKVINCTSYVM